MIWQELTSLSQWAEVVQLSWQKPVAVFKHSTRCSISSTAKSRLERDWQGNEPNFPVFYLDLIAHRDVSNAIAMDTGVEHQSPQMIVLKDGKPVYDGSHNMINAQRAKASV
jgi:bacillithiol system protein YtxJ